MATCEAMIIYFTMYGLFGDVLFNGAGNDIYSLGLVTYSACVVVINTKLQALEVHNKTYLSVIVMVISIGGWFCWNMILSRRYNMNAGKGVYHVRGNFLEQTGHSLSFWLVLLVTVVAAVVFEVAVSAVRANLFPTDVDIFQEYEQDLEIRRRFEEAAAMELQQGWDRGSKKASFELAGDAAAEAENGAQAAEAEVVGETAPKTNAEDERERQVQELLSRPRVMMAKTGSGQSAADTNDYNHQHQNHSATSVYVPGSAGRSSEDDGTRSREIHELFSKGFGTIRKGHLK